MFSRIFNAQNKVSISIIPITAVTFSIAVNSTSTYTGSAQSVTVVSVSPPGATYTTSTTSATNAGGVAQTTITGTGIYTGSFTSPTLTITPASITGVTFSIGAATNSTYTGSAQSVTVVSVTPAAATYSTSTNFATNAGSVASTTVTGTGNYTGSFTSPNLTITKANLSVSGFTIANCGGFLVGRMAFNVSGLVASQTASLTVWIGSSSPTSIAPVSTNDSLSSNSVSQITGANPISVGNGTYTASNSPLYLNVNDFGISYWLRLTGSSNYNDSAFSNSVYQDCGS